MIEEINYETLSTEELQKLHEEYSRQASIFFNQEQSIKLTLNSIYGAMGNMYCTFFNRDIAETITLQAQDSILFMEEMINKYFTDFWHKDTKLHEQLGVSVKGSVKKPVGIYIDTDSTEKNTNIYTKNDIVSIEELYNRNIKNGSAGETLNGHESVLSSEKILNWTKDNNLYFVPIKRIIRHKVTKDKYKLKTKSGKEVIVTGDHSLVVFRNGDQVVVKPYEILKGDKIISINEQN